MTVTGWGGVTQEGDRERGKGREGVESTLAVGRGFVPRGLIL